MPEVVKYFNGSATNVFICEGKPNTFSLSNTSIELVVQGKPTYNWHLV
jgi:hypothetical protein